MVERARPKSTGEPGLRCAATATLYIRIRRKTPFVSVMTPPKSDHFDGWRFVNPGGEAGQPFSAVPRMLLERRTPWPARIDDPLHRPPPLDGAAAVATFIGHATFLIQTAAANILTDPMYSLRAGPMNMLGPRRVRRFFATSLGGLAPSIWRSFPSARTSRAGSWKPFT